MNDLSLSWSSLSSVCSLVGALHGYPSLAFCLARPKGEKRYKIVLNIENEFIPLDTLLKSHPKTEEFLEKLGFFATGEDLSNFVLQQLQEDKWNAHYSKKHQWTQCSWRFLPAKFFSSSPNLNHWYWNEVLEKRAKACPQDKWAVRLHDLLQAPPNTKAIKEVSTLLQTFSLKRQSWENQSGQSLRFWAQNDKKWQSLLDKWGVSYRHSHNGTALVVWALANGWSDVVKGWQKETNLSMEFVPPFEDLPTSWQNDNGQNGSLWHWACAFAPVDLVKKIASSSDFDINNLSTYGQTALHWACHQGQADTVRFLLSCPNIALDIEDQEHKIASELLSEDFNELFDEMEDLRLKKISCLEKQK